MKNKNILLVGIGLAALYFLTKKDTGNTNNTTLNTKREALIDWLLNSNASEDTKNRVSTYFQSVMSDIEINNVYDYVFNYVTKNRSLPKGTALYDSLIVISEKYNIFN